MRRSSSTWLFSLWLLLAGAAPAAAWFDAPLCLPPLFEGGQRLHAFPSPTLFWLEPALRQHELCWHRAWRRDETRIVVLGNSGPLGLPLPAEQTFIARINAAFAADGVPAHVFNLAWVGPYQLRDMVILDQALRFDPDVVLYPIVLDDFIHSAPWMGFGGLTAHFMQSNWKVLRSWVGDAPEGLEQPVGIYQWRPAYKGPNGGPLDHLRDLGSALRLAVRATAHPAATALAHDFPPEPEPPPPHLWPYDCAKTLAYADQYLRDWQSWNSLAHLDRLRRDRIGEVVVVLWPLAYLPDGACYNFRYPTALVDEFRRFVAEECARRGLPFIDLLDALPNAMFVDSLHVGVEGQRLLAERLAPALATIVRDVRARRPPDGAAN